MFQHVVRWTFMITIWKKYKGQLLTTIGYFIGLLLISFVHQDYLDFVKAANEDQQYVATSFMFKWLAYIGITLVYYWVFTRFSKSAESADHAKGSSLGFLKKYARKSTSTSNKGDSPLSAGYASEKQGTPKQAPDFERNDPFENIRNKSKLRSEADILLDQKKSSDK